MSRTPFEVCSPPPILFGIRENRRLNFQLRVGHRRGTPTRDQIEAWTSPGVAMLLKLRAKMGYHDVRNLITLKIQTANAILEQLTLAGLGARQIRHMEPVTSIPENLRSGTARSTSTGRVPDIALYPASSSPAFRMVPSAIEGIAAFDIPHDVDTSYLGHGYFRYIGKYPPQLVSYVLNKYAPEPPILDPMCGGGTTLIEARLRGFDATGCDVNPVARLVSRVVSHPLPPRSACRGKPSIHDGPSGSRDARILIVLRQP
jgi:hypothetical protein